MVGELEFLSFACQALDGLDRAPAPHHRLMIEKLEDVATGRCDRLMIQMPPGSAKSTYGSILFPAYFFSRHPIAQIIGTAHTASLADYFGRHLRNTIVEHGELLGLTVGKTSRGSARFSLETGDEYFAPGVKGPITGRRGDLILIDDPVQSWAEAESPRFRNALYDWYRAELTARLKPEGRIVLMMTRWHEDDLARRLMRTEGGNMVSGASAFEIDCGGSIYTEVSDNYINGALIGLNIGGGQNCMARANFIQDCTDVSIAVQNVEASAGDQIFNLACNDLSIIGNWINYSASVVGILIRDAAQNILVKDNIILANPGASLTSALSPYTDTAIVTRNLFNFSSRYLVNPSSVNGVYTLTFPDIVRGTPSRMRPPTAYRWCANPSPISPPLRLTTSLCSRRRRRIRIR